MNADPIRTFLEEKILEREFPSVAWLVARGEDLVSSGALGLAHVEPEEIEARFDTIYDLASLTKPLATGLLAALLIERGEFSLADPVRRFLPEFDREDKRDITFADLLSHRSGLEAWRPFYLEVEGATRDERLSGIAARIAELPLEYSTGSRVVYSDLNFILLCAVIERISGEDLSRAAESAIFGPLGLSRTCFVPPQDLRSSIAASEEGNQFEKETAEAAGFDVSGYGWRTETIVGEVHDGNAHFLGGISGHAGLFADISDTWKLARQFLPDSSRILKAETCAIFTQDLTPGLEQARSVAFQLASTGTSSGHGALPESAFGHLGFTGTMVWIEPASASVFLLLTNRTHGRKPPFADLFETRREFLKLSFGLNP